MEKQRICATCGMPGMVLDTRDIPHTYKGRTQVIKGITGHYCPTCGEVELAGTGPDGERFSQEVIAFVKRVNAELADASFISDVRKKLGLTQKVAGELFGGGKNGFGRYESGRAVPPVGLVALFRILEKHPELLDEVTAEPAALKSPAISKKGRAAAAPQQRAEASS